MSKHKKPLAKASMSMSMSEAILGRGKNKDNFFSRISDIQAF